MATDATFKVVTGVQVYFFGPHSPWRRATNKNSLWAIRDSQILRSSGFAFIRPVASLRE
jgi:IS30 family transposase